MSCSPSDESNRFCMPATILIVEDEPAIADELVTPGRVRKSPTPSRCPAEAAGSVAFDWMPPDKLALTSQGEPGATSVRATCQS